MEPRQVDRFWSKVDKSGECWVWTAAKFGNGYGLFKPDYRGKSCLAHRVAYEIVVGPIPEGLTIDHLCRNHGCVNPSHLEAVTKRENTLRGVGPAAQHAQQTHCKHGHPFDDENTWIDSTGARHCRVCKRAACQRWFNKHRDEYNTQKRAEYVHRPYVIRKGIPHGPMSDETKQKISASRQALFAQRRAIAEQQSQ